ncbi:Putative xanthine dehydrogenase YagS FAD-binding subunit [Streptomyces davaonensis JCM 4913]|uniref:Putative xanthine dehydrogenase YagS FAD-binding subunit n=1 Tax=Streptomyces davaonensis (strain DSM 101723 / JCM 4913 / KCC S-0913 / 768) TaxID=1214101 RepID=K4QTA0_STRDJ|nr:xanthine dehydrogenase family protein subunit M [Streptomyces davaonensis]CCK26036.1 Putative xanthine dehydrogenase YagS FAD-binding subunit [Streptomyces davaonensis JCM 4913]
MRPFAFAAPRSLQAAVGRATGSTRYVAGGTTLVDLMKLEVMTPERVLDINLLPLKGITYGQDGLYLGALERMSDVADHPLVRRHYPAVAQALELSASQQLRNMASMGGNLLQRTRCGYFRDTAMPCNKREPGSGCPALNGENRGHAVLGTSTSCVATHPSDVAVALVALDARLHIYGPKGHRTTALEDFYRLPGDTPHLEHHLQPRELITAITVPPPSKDTRSGYLKIRDRQSYEFALTSAAVALQIHHRTIREAKVAVGGVGTRPWRLPAVERALVGRPAGETTYEAAADQSTQGAQPLEHNEFKVELLRRTLIRALITVGGTR